MTYVVLGSSGFVGSHIAKALADSNPVLTHHQNPRHPGSIKFDVFNDTPDFLPEPPATIILASAIEFEPEKQVEAAMRRLLPFLESYRLVYLSSDGIFDGDEGNYSETDVPKPKTLYGRNLLTCETLIRDSLADYLIVRPSYVYGEADALDKRLQKVKAALNNGEELYFFEDMYKSPLGVGEVARAVTGLAKSTHTGTLHIAGERMSIYDFYRRAMTALGMDASKLLARAMPDKPEFLRDTSLDSSKAWESLGWRPRSIEEVFSQSKSTANR